MNADKIDPTRVKMVQELKHASPLVGCRFDPSGRYVFAGAQDNTIQRWELATGKKTVLSGHKSWVRALAFAAKDKVLFSGDYAGRILAWPMDADDPKPLRTIKAHHGWVRALSMSPDGRTLASCGNDGLVRLWSVPDGKAVPVMIRHTCHVYDVAFHPDGKSLVSGDLKGAVKQWDMTEGAVGSRRLSERIGEVLLEVLLSLTPREREIIERRFGPYPLETAIRDFDGSVLHKYDTTFCADHGGVRSMAFSPDGRLLACAGITDVSNAFAGVGKPVVVLFDVATGQRKQLLRPKTDFQGTCWGVVCHPDGFLAGAGGGNGGALWFWKPDAAQAFHTLALPNNSRDLDLHPDGKRLAVAFFDGAVRVYDLAPKAAG